MLDETDFELMITPKGLIRRGMQGARQNTALPRNYIYASSNREHLNGTYVQKPELKGEVYGYRTVLMKNVIEYSSFYQATC